MNATSTPSQRATTGGLLGGPKGVSTSTDSPPAFFARRSPNPVPPIIPRTKAERERYETAKIRVKARKELLKKIS